MLKHVSILLAIIALTSACSNSNPGSKSAQNVADSNGYYVPVYTSTGGSSSSTGGSTSGDDSSGSSSSSSGGSDSSSGSSSSSDSSSSSGSSSSDGSSGGSDDGDDDTVPLDPVIQLRGRAVGPYQTVEFSVLAKCNLKVRMIAGVQDRTVAATNFKPTYSKLAAHIVVKTADKTTPLLYNGAFGGSAVRSPVYDFSRKLDCEGEAKQYKIKVSRFSNDFYCINYGQYCPSALVHETHPVNFRLYVETDFTEALDLEDL